MTDHGQMWPKYLPLATLAYNTFNSPNLGNYSPYELVFGRKLKLLLDLETDPDIKVLGTYKDYCTLLNKRLQYLHKLLQDFRSKRLALINKDGYFFQYNSGDLVYIISPLTSQLENYIKESCNKMHVSPLEVYKIIDLDSYLLMTMDGKLLRGLSGNETLKPAVLRTNQSNVSNLTQLKQVMALGLLDL